MRLLSSFTKIPTAAVLLHLSLTTATTTTSQNTERRLQDQGEYVPYSLKYGPCFFQKIVEDNDDDGNSYFYNGAYRVQYERYAVSFACDENGDCDSGREFVVDLDSYLEFMTDYVQKVCYSCANQCQGGRRLEDADEDQEYVYVNCDTCVSECNSYIANQNNGGVDETNYLECQQAKEENDIAYYSAPQCSKSGDITIGLFYDNECSIKASGAEWDQEFSYNTFKTIQEISVYCYNGDDDCNELLQDAIYCENGYADDDDNRKLCRSAKKAAREQIYYHKPWYEKIPFITIALVLALLAGSFFFLSYTYYIRHQERGDPSTPLAEMDGKPLPEVT